MEPNPVPIARRRDRFLRMRIIQRLVLAVFFLCLTVACTAPDQHDSVRYGTKTVAFANAFNSDDVAVMSARRPSLDHLGPGFTIVGSYIEDDCHGADICVHHWDSGATTPGCPMGAAAQWRVGTGDIDLDPVCTTNDVQKQTEFEHEIGHALGMSHICAGAADPTTDCSPVGDGDAVMNARLTMIHDDTVFIEDYGDTITTVDFTDLDLAEFRRVHP